MFSLRLTSLILMMTASCQLSAASAPSPALRPNIILILADDLGVETLNSYGGESYQTPRLDQLASEGMRFENAHAQPLCTPSRVKLMTGKYNFRNYQHFMYLDPNETTFAHVLRDAGYRTMIAGKWQLVDNGFDEVEGMLPENAGFDDYFLWQIRRKGAGSRYWSPAISHNGELKTYSENTFGPDLFNAHVIDFIEQYSTQPFFIYYPMALPHYPLVTTPDSPDAKTDEARFAGMIAYMDKLVGKVRDKVIEQGLAENTLIFFIGDNGTDTRLSSLRNGQLIPGGKGETTDNGSHVPFIAWWPQTIPKTQIDSNLVNLNDFFPTLAELAGAPLPDGHPHDGISLVEVLRGKTTTPIRSEQFIHYNPRWGKLPGRYSFDDQWKLYESGDFYNTRIDPAESNKISAAITSGEATAARKRLASLLEKMSGGPVPTWPTAPTTLYYIGAAILLAIIMLAIGLGIFLKRKLAKIFINVISSTKND